MLARQLAGHPELVVVGEAASVADAAELCGKLQPDLLFLDVEMPGLSGFELLPMLRQLPGIIFMADEDLHAVRAIEVGAVDFLLKPLALERLQVALARLRGRIPDARAHPAPRPLYMVDIMVVPLHRSYRIVPTRHIVSLRADANYSILNLSDGKELYVYRALNQWEDHLPPQAFLRVDRSLIIAPAHIRALEVEKREVADLYLTGLESPIRIGRTAIGRIRDYFGALDLASLPRNVSV